MEDIDLLELGSYTELQGGNISLPSGYSSILDPISKNIPHDKLLLNHKVVSVRWKYKPGPTEDGHDSDDSDKTVIEFGEEGEASADDEDSDDIVIRCKNGAVFRTQSVICSLPLGVLQCDTKLFSPSLPKAKRDSMQRLLFGTVNKIFLVYQRPFLEPNLSEILLLWNDSDDEQQELQNQNKNLSETWFKKIYSFAKVTETLLLAWISGEEAEYMETLPDDIISETCTTVLRKFLNDPLIPKPKQCICSRWKSDEFSRGSYTAMAVGASQVDIADLAQPICSNTSKGLKPVIAFAGEHTHSNFYSTVHGAYLTGRTAAQLLVSHLFTEDNEGEVTVECDETDMSTWIQKMSLQ